MTELTGDPCDHYDRHIRLAKERTDDNVIEHFICWDCGSQWKYERSPTVGEELEHLNKQLRELKEEILSEICN